MMKIILRKNIILSAVKKEFSQVMRDMRMRGILFGSPLMMLLVFGYAVNTDVSGINLGVYDEDHSAMSREIVQKFTASRYFVPGKYCSSEKEMVPLMDSGRIELFLHIPARLSADVKAGKEAQIQVIIDGSDSSRAAVLSAYTNIILNTISAEKYLKRIRAALTRRLPNRGDSGRADMATKINRGIELEERIFYNPALLSRNFFLPAVIGLVISLVTIMLTSMSIVKERETGTIEQITVSPMRPVEYILGKTIPFAIVGFIDMFVVSMISIFWFKVPFNGSFLFLLIAGALFILTTLSVGIYISTISQTQQQAMLSFFIFFVPAMLLSGFVFPVYAMPVTIQALTYFNPIMYFIDIIRGVFLKGTGFLILWKDMLALLVMGTGLFVLSVRRMSRRME